MQYITQVIDSTIIDAIKWLRTKGHSMLASPTNMAPTKIKRRKQEDRTRETRKKLMAATRICVAREGYAQTTISKIVKEAGVSRGAHLHHFTSKEHLIEAATEDAGHQVFRRLGLLMLNLDNEDDRLECLIHAVWTKVMLSTEGKLILEFLIAARTDQNFARHFSRSFKQVRATFAVAAVHYFEAKSNSPFAPDEMFDIIIRQLHGLLLDAPLTQSSAELDADVSRIILLAKQFIKAKPDVTGPPLKLPGFAE